jgi:hypothetical protein
LLAIALSKEQLDIERSALEHPRQAAVRVRVDAL